MKRETEERVDWKKYAAVTVSVSAGLLALWLFLRYGVRVLLPFLLAWVLSLLILPLSERVAARTRLPKRLCAALLLLLLFALLVGTVCVSVRRLLREIEGLLALFLEDPDGIEGKIQQLVEFFSETAEKIPILSSLTGEEGGSLLGIDLGAFVVDLVRESASELTAALPRLVGRVIAGVPQALLFLLVLLISSFYFTLDGDGIARGVRRLLPLPLASRTEGLGKRVSALLYRYLRVYLVLFLLTLTELLVGLTLLGRDYAFLLALVISALDVLPLLGVGSVLLPWAGYRNTTCRRRCSYPHDRSPDPSRNDPHRGE